jgi:nucleotide-binding universal stress UspA family protein
MIFPGVPMSYRTVLFAIDEDPLAEAHADHAAGLARAFEARLVGLSCHRPTPWPSDGAVAFLEGDPLTIELRTAEEAAVAWDGSDSAARAASAALPLLRRAPVVHLVQVADPRQEDSAALRPGLERAAEWLSGHGVVVRADVAASRLPAGEELRAQLAHVGAELLVMGAWGHRRVVERLLGGATRTMVDGMIVPVLFAH